MWQEDTHPAVTQICVLPPSCHPDMRPATQLSLRYVSCHPGVTQICVMSPQCHSDMCHVTQVSLRYVSCHPGVTQICVMSPSCHLVTSTCQCTEKVILTSDRFDYITDRLIITCWSDLSNQLWTMQYLTWCWFCNKINHTLLWGSDLCSPGPMFPGSYVPRVLCSPGPMFPGSYVPRVLCSPGPMFPGSLMFPGSYVRGGGGGGGGGGVEHIVANIVIYVGIYNVVAYVGI